MTTVERCLGCNLCIPPKGDRRFPKPRPSTSLYDSKTGKELGAVHNDGNGYCMEAALRRFPRGSFHLEDIAEVHSRRSSIPPRELTASP